MGLQDQGRSQQEFSAEVASLNEQLQQKSEECVAFQEKWNSAQQETASLQSQLSESLAKLAESNQQCTSASEDMKKLRAALKRQELEVLQRIAFYVSPL